MTAPADAGTVVLLKLGGSLVTFKDRDRSVNDQALDRALGEIARARDGGARIVVAHGSGSFGHRAAIEEDFARLASSSRRVTSGARIQEAVRALHSHIQGAALRRGLPFWSLPPSAACVSRNGSISVETLGPAIHAALDCGAVPLLCGDAICDEDVGVRIASTEEILLHLWTDVLKPAGIRARAVWAGTTDGILDVTGTTVADVTAEAALALAGPSQAPDVTGGMLLRVRTVLALMAAGCGSLLVNGLRDGEIASAILDPEAIRPDRTRAAPSGHSS